ncbi:hypothetical protein K469DRAFT_804028 [Zopfia rhizophila CBS 207.26]|uniref:Nucleoporin Nup133/Nup155-like C-terminal domain-containing protein n=1 Tax=Zopfia rhizophila CBS 207.26 TaxID=1314779 RepID=A0A6A6DF41_9PEZI|nr:hypothetical protein K469DRAFT_804028 [Zopfia rhizophila CBS 207.26]
MFSSEVTAQSLRGSSLRNPRRRQRKDSDSLRQQPHRKRSKLSEDTFNSPSSTHVNGNGSASMNGHVSYGEVDSSLVVVDMPVREKKPSAKRGQKDDGGMYLTKNENYSVRKLPSFPNHLCSDSAPFRAFALPSSGFALALTSEHALAWDYTCVASPPKVLTLPLPFGLRPSDPLPLGAIVRNGPTNDFGIVAVAPSTGKITFWENVDSAEARSHFPQRHQGVDGSVGRIYSGELITGLVDIEHAGYVLIFSSGRLAQLTLRDSQGRPNITVNFLHSSTSSNSGFFNIKGLLGSAIRKPIASVKARASESKGQMEVITATKDGLLQFWDLNWSGQQLFKKEINMYTEASAALQAGTAPESRGQHDIQFLDFAILNQPRTHDSQISLPYQQRNTNLLALVALSGVSHLEYSLLEVDLTENTCVISRAVPVRQFQQSQLPKEPTATLLLPEPGHTAFVQFPNAIVIASLAEPEESPDAQLLSDSGRPSLPYQDAIYFREDHHVQVCGCAVEQSGRKDRQSSAVLFVQSFGIIQITALPPATDDEAIGRHKVTAGSKLEQATFFSTIPDNILDFSIRSRHVFGQEEVEKAAEEISTGILTSSFEFVEKVTSSMDDQIRKRRGALRNLVSHLRSDYPPLSFKTKWRLLWDAEKLAAAQQLWKRYEERRQDQQKHPEAYAEKPLFPDLVTMLHDRYKTQIRPEFGETDPVRQYFLKDVNRLEIILPWGWQLLRTAYLDGSKDRPSVMQRISEANDVTLVALETAFNFRQENIEFYGLDPDSLEDGLLMPDKGYDALPQFWTSTHNIVHATRHLVDVGRATAVESFEHGTLEDLAAKIAKDNPRLVKICCQIHIERFRWALEQSDERTRDTGQKLKKEFDDKVRSVQIYKLVDIDATEGMNLAEHYRDMPTLVNLIWDETKFLTETKESTSSKMEEAECLVKLNRIRERIRRYFDKYGEPWADAFYSRYIEEHRSARLFMKDYLNQSALTKFLRAEPSRARLRWINEVCGEKDYEAAGKALLEVATHQEQNAWCKKVELSIAKLAILCGKQQKLEDGEKAEDDLIEKTEAELNYAKVQDRVYDLLSPTISGALDDESALQLLKDEFAQGHLSDRPAHQQLLHQGFEHLINHRVMQPLLLIDVLTLMTYDHSIQSNQFAFALNALAIAWDGMDKTTRESTLRIIWKRIYIQDDWASINDTKDITDDQLTEDLVQTMLGYTLGQVFRMLEESDRYQVVLPPAPHKVLGAGCTNEELSGRFKSEDLRNPIISDNLADDEILQTFVEKHRLDEWFDTTAKIAKEYAEPVEQQDGDQMFGSTDSNSDEGEAPPSEATSTDAPEAFDGDDEQSVDQDVEMEDR